MNHSAQLFIFPLFWWEHWVCLKLPIKTNTGRPHIHTCLFSPALKKKIISSSGGDMQSSISLGIEFILPTQHLIKQALCALPLPCLRQSRVLCLWAAQAAEMWILHADSSYLPFISPQAEVRVLGLQHSPCWFSWCSCDKPAMCLPHRALEK